ncbi:DUF465 domain-containing protein [Pseudomonas akapageensis]|uniref:DUF465 domain-containing protein n=1 Tax=Pseudomonas akapageensis TaxID=2609961 RepID=UPI00140DE471|nr:DUF465 domain-containing protein [Pseudomonas akapageensis]
MPVRHNLYEDLKLTKEEVEQRRKTDERLGTLLSKYEELDKQVLDAAAKSAPDDQLKKLKEERLLAKDKIVQQLEYPNSRGAAKQF